MRTQRAVARGQMLNVTKQEKETISEANMTPRVRWNSQNTATALHHLLSLHGRFHPHISLLFFMGVTNCADPELQFQPSPVKKRARAGIHVLM